MSTTQSAIDLAPLVNVVAPLLAAVLLAVITGLVKIGVGELAKLSGVQIDAATQKRVVDAIDNLAASEVAAAGDNLATTTITVSHPLVAKIAAQIESSLPAELHALGLDPDAVAGMVTAAFGKLQAKQ